MEQHSNNQNSNTERRIDMSVLFGGTSKSRDISDIVTRLKDSSIVNESISGATLPAIEIQAMAESISKLMNEYYGADVSEQFEDMIVEDAKGVAQMFKNNLVETGAVTLDSNGEMNEAALMPSLVTLTASIATTMRIPYEAVLHRLFDTRTIDKQTVEIEEVIPTLRAPGDDKAEDLIDALAPYAPVPFVTRTEIEVDTLVDGLEMDCKDVPLLRGKDPRFRINRDVRFKSADIELDGKVVPQQNISIAKGSEPYFSARENTMHLLLNVKKEDGSIYTADVTAKIDFDQSVMCYIRGDKAVKKVYFYATVSHQEHTHPIHTSFRNNFEQFVVPTRPHIEVSMPQEMRTDISNSIQHFANTDIVTAMTEQITVISSRMEDQRLKMALDQGYEYVAQFPFDAPPNFAYGNLEWLKREFIPFLDQCALKLKNERNCTDCHFRVGVSPYILRILDTDYTMDKAATEDSRGSGVINYSIGVKTSTSVFYFVSSQLFEDNKLQMLLIPNNFKMSAVKTYNYFKYSSFLTDQLRRADSPVQPAIVYSERNLPVVFETVCTDINIDGMPTMKTDGPRYIKRVME